MTALTIQLNSIIDLTDQQFYNLCQANRDVRFERTATGELVIMSPTGSETGNRNGRFNQRLFNWSDQDESGIAFDSSTGFKLPNGADRSPDAAWVKLDRWNALNQEQQQRFAPICPDFVVELLSPSDNLTILQAKMQEYLDNGARLGWLINRQTRQVEIYRPDRLVEVLENPESLSGEDVLPGFTLQMLGIW
ncbi:Uma2 family endonuclease [Phormidesmis priestleyi ULC007]|uniref:Uma2 family endonuclease n=1 Tax=Phormidesmis priestleyi ULC007 TaxID=1920490 RepID=A0A2T1DHY0_9CYAN|nr:Uma2 family endonuclease [Phormidesmis priestleyi]PSB20075.1 Uma2 family endonuclease [Phormidesmis priestleyi ULC007]PZO48939.1 MAG: Uma2 family endonuclease [Phormidesmis priestleyi]